MADEQALAPVFSARQLSRARDLLTRIYALRRAARLYPDGNPVLAAAVAELAGVLRQYFDEGVDVPLTFYENELLLGEQLLAQESVLFDQLIRDMTGLGASGITFRRSLTPVEIETLGAVFRLTADEIAAEGGLAPALETRGVRHIAVMGVTVMRENELDEDRVNAARAAYGGALDFMREIDRLIRSGRMVNAAQVKGTVRSLIGNVLESRSAMLELSALKSFDEYTYYHSVNVAILSLALGTLLSRDHRFLSTLGTGALMHDVGKLSIDAAIIGKQGPLDSAEWEEVRRHPVYGASTTALTRGVDRGAVVAVIEHHRRFDGTGYPGRPGGRRQHLVSRIVAIADAYDAMTSRRAYSPPRRQDEAIATLLRNAGTALDPALVGLFVQLMGRYPPRSVVRLKTGEIAIVLAANERNAAAPLVRVIADDLGRLVTPRDVDLAAIGVPGSLPIASCIDPSALNIDVGDFL